MFILEIYKKFVIRKEIHDSVCCHYSPSPHHHSDHRPEQFEFVPEDRERDENSQ
jgi:hypothetical protein